MKNEANLYEPLYRTCYRDFPTNPRPPSATGKWRGLLICGARDRRCRGAHPSIPAIGESERCPVLPRAVFRTRLPVSAVVLFDTGSRQECGGARKTNPIAGLPAEPCDAGASRPGAVARVSRVSGVGRVRVDLGRAKRSQFVPSRDGAGRDGVAARRARRLDPVHQEVRPGLSFDPARCGPEKFWKLAFPLPYRTALESSSREQRTWIRSSSQR